jgi:hypothetical protein
VEALVIDDLVMSARRGKLIVRDGNPEHVLCIDPTHPA